MTLDKTETETEPEQSAVLTRLVENLVDPPPCRNFRSRNAIDFERATEFVRGVCRVETLSFLEESGAGRQVGRCELRSTYAQTG